MKGDLPFSTEGFFEDFMEADTAKYLGKRTIEWPDRVMGSTGLIDDTLTAPIVLKRNMKEVTYKASEASPLKVRRMIVPLCGRVIQPGNLVKVLRSPADQSGKPNVAVFDGIDEHGRVHLRAGKVCWTEDESWRLRLI
jgi:hypothetical protein